MTNKGGDSRRVSALFLCLTANKTVRSFALFGGDRDRTGSTLDPLLGGSVGTAIIPPLLMPGQVTIGGGNVLEVITPAQILEAGERHARRVGIREGAIED